MKIKREKNKSLGISINFDNLSPRQRLSVWWTFTLAALFKRDTRTKHAVKSINIVADNDLSAYTGKGVNIKYDKKH